MESVLSELIQDKQKAWSRADNESGGAVSKSKRPKEEAYSNHLNRSRSRLHTLCALL